MDTKDLAIFKAVYETKSINKAANDIYMSPQGISKVIKKIEGELGAELFKRTSAGVVPTRQADNLYLIANNVKELLNSIHMDKLDVKKKLNVVFAIGVIRYLGIDYLTGLNKLFEDYDLNIQEENDERCLSLLKDRKADFGIVGGPVDPVSYNIEFYMAHPHVAVLNKNHALAKKEKISLSDLHDETIALVGHQFGPYTANLLRFAKANVIPAKIIEVNEIEMVQSLAARGPAIGISVDFVASANPYPDTVTRRFDDDSISWDTYFVSLNGTSKTSAYKKFCEYTRKYIKEEKQ